MSHRGCAPIRITSLEESDRTTRACSFCDLDCTRLYFNRLIEFAERDCMRLHIKVEQPVVTHDADLHKYLSYD